MSINQWLTDRRLKLELKQLEIEVSKKQELEERRVRLAEKAEQVLERLDEAGFTRIRRANQDTDYLTTTTWVIRGSTVYEVEINVKGAMFIKRVK